MEFGAIEIYLIIVNIIGFAASAINTKIASHSDKGSSETVPAIVSLLGGSLGTLLAILIFDRKAQKGNMLARVIIACVFVIQTVILLIVKGTLRSPLTFAFWDFYAEHIWILVYLGVINVVAFTAFAADKLAAVGNKNRVRIVTLLGLAFIGGSIGGLLGMYILRHKTKKNYFTVGIPLIMVMQAVVLFYLMNTTLLQ